MATSHPSNFFTPAPPGVSVVGLRLTSSHNILDPGGWAEPFGQGTIDPTDPKALVFNTDTPVQLLAVSGVGHVDLDSADGYPRWSNPPVWISNPSKFETTVINTEDIDPDGLLPILKQQLPKKPNPDPC